MRFIVGIERRPRERIWSLRLGGRKGGTRLHGAFRSFLGLNPKIKGDVLHNFKKKSCFFLRDA